MPAVRLLTHAGILARAAAKKVGTSLLRAPARAVRIAESGERKWRVPVKDGRVFALVGCIVALLGAGAGSAVRMSRSGRSIVYSDAYKKLLGAFPAGYADDCEIHAV